MKNNEVITGLRMENGVLFYKTAELEISTRRIHPDDDDPAFYAEVALTCESEWIEVENEITCISDTPTEISNAAKVIVDSLKELEQNVVGGNPLKVVGRWRIVPRDDGSIDYIPIEDLS